MNNLMKMKLRQFIISKTNYLGINLTKQDLYAENYKKHKPTKIDK